MVKQVQTLPVAPSRERPAQFSDEANAFLGALPNFGYEINEVAVEVNSKAKEAANQVNLAAQQVDLAANQVNLAAQQVDLAANQVRLATAQADAARDSAISAAGAANYKGDYNPASTYTVGQSVSYGALRFAAKRTVTGVTPVDGADWLLIHSGSAPTLQGYPAPYVNQTVVYQITNFNSFSSYTVSASAGTASISGDTITYAAPATAGSVDLTLTVDGQPAVFAINVQAVGVATPTNVSPADGAVNIGAAPTLQSSAFVAHGATDTHLASRWTLYQGGVEVHSSGWLTDALTSYTVPAGVMAVSTGYAWTVEHRGATLGDSAPSVATSFTTAASFGNYIPTPTPTPANFGDPLEGGFYAGMIWNQLAQSATSMALATGSKTFTVPDMTDAPIVYQGQMVEVRSRANPANKFIGTVTGALGTNLTINVTSIGGNGTFSDWSIMARHRIIVAPKASGEHADIVLKNTNSALPTTCQTLTEGFAATQAMFTADSSTVYPAAHWARNLNINGYIDWYIPARDELELCWRNLKPVTNNNYVTANRPVGASFNYANNGSYGDTANTHGLNNNSAPTGAAYTAAVPAQTTATAFRTGGTEAFEFGSAYYWSSSDYVAAHAWSQSWVSSYPGYQVNNGKTSTPRVRAVRRSVI